MLESQPILTNRIHESILSNRSVDFHPRFVCFPIIHHNSVFSALGKRACYLSAKSDICAAAS